jgi:transcription antitermination factor NusA-like protein
MYVPEIKDGTIQIENVVRYPGVQTKILVSSSFDEIDP